MLCRGLIKARGYQPARQYTPYLPLLRQRHTDRVVANTFTEDQRSEFQDQIDELCSKAVIATYSHADGRFIEWTERKGLGIDGLIGAYNQGTVTPPRCPHGGPGERFGQMRLHKRHPQDPNRSYTGYWEADTHGCEFRVYVPTIAGPNRVRAASVEVDEDAAGSSEAGSSPTRPRPRPSFSLSSKVSYFNEAKANERRQYDEMLCAIVKSSFDAQVYVEHSEEHPAFNILSVDSTPRSLRPFHPDSERLRERVLEVTAAHLHTPISLAIQELHTSVGLDVTIWTRLLMQTIYCPSCECEYSIEGFKQHLNFYGECTNTPAFLYVAASQTAFDHLPTLTSHDYPVRSVERDPAHLHTATGVAWLAWHSRIGIPQEAWVLLTTAIQRCKTCNRIRCFSADFAHRDTSGVCRYAGEGARGSIASEDEA